MFALPYVRGRAELPPITSSLHTATVAVFRVPVEKVTRSLVPFSLIGRWEDDRLPRMVQTKFIRLGWEECNAAWKTGLCRRTPKRARTIDAGLATEVLGRSQRNGLRRSESITHPRR